ncbi:DUF2213 domain-containing protein [Phaeovibrio sulfidiphilus]|uniref:DUF2213 domain-containing protein n=1 Tax=Phaeovibrio sulfidiphilus TaxID=1220600 RepID=A0A8J7CWH4_9PROT|nr:DUF2213 domain-containing protein [Phaeovibrio sulfidiphilus]MBE1237486.1 DUF2213 domain-containing protein [Phaeovibrio sulfidiphilus]
MERFSLALDRAVPASGGARSGSGGAHTARSIDENGFLRIRDCPISKEAVNPYLGEEIPGWEDLGLDPGRVYRVYRPGRELAAAAASFEGLPLLLDHHPDSARHPQKEHRIGSVSGSVRFRAPYLLATLIVTDATAIRAIETGAARELSCAYAFDPVLRGGTFRGEPYEIVMTNIRGNHVALVAEGRAGPDVHVRDGSPFSVVNRCAPRSCAPSSSPASGGSHVTTFPTRALSDEPHIPDPGAAVPETDPDSASLSPPDGPDRAEAREKLALLLEALEESDPEMADALHDCLRILLGEADPDTGAAAAGTAGAGPDLAPAGVPSLAQDARRLRRATLRHAARLIEAARKVRPILGDIENPLALDDASTLYRRALEASGIDPRAHPRTAYAGMVDVLLSAGAGRSLSDVFTPAPDPSSFEGPFAHLGNIRR